MRKKQANATTIRLEQADREAIARIRELYGCPSDAAAIKLAVRMVARETGSPPVSGGAFIPPLERGGSSRTE
jgi:hypothetical protein